MWPSKKKRESKSPLESGEAGAAGPSSGFFTPPPQQQPPQQPPAEAPEPAMAPSAQPPPEQPPPAMAPAPAAKPVANPTLPPPGTVAAVSAAPQKKPEAQAEFKLRIPADVLRVDVSGSESGPPLSVAMATHARQLGVFCSAVCSALGRVLLVLRLVIAVPIGLVIFAALGLLAILLLLQLVWLLPLALLLGLLLPHEREASVPPMALPSQHIVVLGGGAGLTRAVALECVRRGADVTVVAAESDALSATYEMMKTTSLDRHATVKQQLRCSPLELTDGPMACFVALQNVLELVGRVDGFICHPAELILEGRGGSGPATIGDNMKKVLTRDDITESVLCCVWAVRALLFPMQRQASGRVMVLGSAPSAASYTEKMSFKLAMQTLNRSLRSELSPYRIPVSLAAPLGSEAPSPNYEMHASQAADAPSGLFGCLTGMGRSRPSLAEYAKHVVSGMAHGAPYILSPGGDGVLQVGVAGGGSGGCFGGLFGYSTLTPAALVLQACTMPLLALTEAGMPIAWREALASCWHGRGARVTSDETNAESEYSRLRDDPLAV